MAVAWRNSAGFADSSGSGTIVCAYDAAVLAGSLLWCGIMYDSTGGITTSGVSDSVNGAWTQAGVSTTNEFSARQEIWYKLNTGAGTPTVTVTLSGSAGFRRLTVTEVTGVATSNALDKTDGDTANTAAPTTGPVTTTTDGQYIAAVLQTSGGRPVTNYDSFTSRDLTSDENEAIDKVQTSAGSITPTLALTTGNVWILSIATFKAAAAGNTFTVAGRSFFSYDDDV